VSTNRFSHDSFNPSQELFSFSRNQQTHKSWASSTAFPSQNSPNHRFFFGFHQNRFGPRGQVPKNHEKPAFTPQNVQELKENLTDPNAPFGVDLLQLDMNFGGTPGSNNWFLLI